MFKTVQMSQSLPDCEVQLVYALAEGESPEEGLEKCRQAIQTYADTMAAVEKLSAKKEFSGSLPEGRSQLKDVYFQGAKKYLLGVDPAAAPAEYIAGKKEAP